MNGVRGSGRTGVGTVMPGLVSRQGRAQPGGEGPALAARMCLLGLGREGNQESFDEAQQVRLQRG